MEKLPSYTPNLKGFLSVMLERCMKTVNAQSASIFLFDEDKQELVLVTSRNNKNVNLEGLRQRLGESVAGRVALEGRPLLVKNADTDPFLTQNNHHHNNYRSKSFLSVPVEFLGNLLGVVNVTEKTTGKAFSTKDLHAVSNISKGLGVTLHSLQSYLEKQKALNEQLFSELKNLKKLLNHDRPYSSLGRLVGNFVHEMNNPLDGVMRYVNLAFDCAEENSIVQEYLRDARSGLTRIANIIKTLLNFSWSNSHEIGEIDVNFLIMECLFTLNHTFIYHNVRVKKSLNENIPHIPDYGLQLVFNNLVKNACDAMKKGGVLTITTGVKDNTMEITFSDTGEGIPPELKNQVFEPFFTTKKMGEGTGIGLTVCSEIIQRYNGNISVESTPGKGSTFTVSLPISS